MIMKANKQIGFIYKNEESIDKILKDGDVVFERGFLREKTSTTLPINFDGVGKDLKDYRVYGNTYQNTTSGKNLLGITANSNSGITSVINSDGSITYSGTATAAYANITQRFYKDLPSGTYILSINKVMDYRVSIRLYYEDGTYQPFAIYAGDTSKIITATQNIKSYYIFIANTLTVGQEYNDTLYIQLEEGSTATEFEPYTGGQPSPNPDYPQEIVSCGDRTKNLFDKNNATILNAYIGASNSTITSLISYRTTYLKVKPNTYYTVSKNSSNDLRIGLSTNNSIDIGDILTNVARTTTDNKLTILTNNDTKTLAITYAYTTVDDEVKELNSLMVEEGSTATPYEPYGYKIPVNVRSENLCNGNLTQGQYRNGVFENDINRFTTDFLEVTPSTQYTFSLNSNDNLASLINLAYFDENKNFLGTRSTMGLDTFSNTDRDKTITTTNETYYLRWTLRPYGSKSSISYEEAVTQKLQFEKGNKTLYQPYYNETTNIYLDEPLRKIGEYNDYIDFINGKVVRNIGETIFDGTESRWAYYTDTNKPVFYMGYVNTDWFYNRTDIWACYCNYYKGKNNVSSFDEVYNYGNNSIAFRTQYPRLVIRDDSKTSLNDFKTWLETHNLKVDYVLSTPTQESITLPNIPTIEGNNTLNIETEITPSQVYIKYKSNT